MPVYEYECVECEARLEERRNVEDRENEKYCHKCSGLMELVMSSCNFSGNFVP